jgi:hypothetical protein
LRRSRDIIRLKPSVIRVGYLTLQHPDRGQEIVSPASQSSGKHRVGEVGNVRYTCPLLLVMDTLVEELNLRMQISDERPQFPKFHRGAEIVQLRPKMGHRVHGSAPFWYCPIMGL